MKRLAAVFVLSLLAHAAVAQPPRAQSITLAEYTAWLERVAAAIEPESAAPGRLTADIPARWQVETSRDPFDVSNAWLLNALRELQSRPTANARSVLVSRLRMFAAEAAAYDAPAPPASGTRQRLSDILSRREFRNVHGPTWVDALRQRIQRLILRFFERLFGSQAIPTVSSILIYVLIALAVVALAGWTYRALRQHAVLDTVVPDRVPVSAKAWTIWLAEAQQAAARGEWRDAVHLAYWCAVSFLEASGSWRPDRARTPREYLRLLPAASQHRPSLAALTRTCELVWYGTSAADARSFADALAHLEKIGCRPS